MKEIRLCLLAGLLPSLGFAAQPEAPEPVAAPMRPLPWGQLNFLQTTDTHGWHAGHLQEPQYSADWGDYISFAQRMREKADNIGVDLLLIDTGDRIEGNGLYDASNPKGKYTYDIVREQDIDVITIGNHELYQPESADREYTKTVPNFKERYLASNLDYIDPKTGDRVPLAQRYRKFTTKNQGIQIVAFGFLFDFTGNANNTRVQKVEDTIKEQWFQDAIREKPDLFLVAGHVTLPGKEYRALYEAIRKQNWDTPIQFFGGHSHIRDFHRYDSGAYGLQAGRYMETIGWMSIEGITPTGKPTPNEVKAMSSLEFDRMYIDNNLFGYYYHTGLNETTFHTEHGKNVSRAIQKARKALKLDHSFGCAPKDLWMSRAKYPSDDSLFTWLEHEVIPGIAVNPDRKDVPTLAITNTGAMRFDIFKGAFTTDTTFIVSPFVSKFQYIKDVPYKSARQVLDLINKAGPVFSATDVEHLAPPRQVSMASNELAASFLEENPKSLKGTQLVLNSRNARDLLPGYITKDDGGNEGDDTLHAPITFYNVPSAIQSTLRFPKDGEPEAVDLVFIDFIQPWVLRALEYTGQKYQVTDVESYRPEPFTELMAGWIKKHWKQDC